MKQAISINVNSVDRYDEVEPRSRGVRDRDQDDIGIRSLEQPRHLVHRADDLHAVDAAAPQARVVVDEPDDTLAGGLAKLPHQAAARPPCTHDQRASCCPVTH